MKATQLLQFQYHLSKTMITGLLSDMQDAPLTFPTPNGGNHPTWVAGHLVYSEANLVHHMLQGNTNPLIDWKPLFAGGTEASDDASLYPPLADILAKWEEVRAHTLQVLDSLSEEDLDQPAVNVPPGREEMFGTNGKVLSMVATHVFLHYGQVADARRATGREKLLA